MNQFLTRKNTADYIRNRGIRCSQSSLARAAMCGSGPNYTLIGNKAYYKPEWIDQWLESQCKPRSHSLAHMTAKAGEGA